MVYVPFCYYGCADILFFVCGSCQLPQVTSPSLHRAQVRRENIHFKATPPAAETGWTGPSGRASG